MRYQYAQRLLIFVAIYEALKLVFKKGITDVCIFSDSLSTIEKLKDNSFKAKISYNIIKMNKLLNQAFSRSVSIVFAWIPGHVGIKGNEEADTLAKVGTNLNVPMKVSVEGRDIFPNIKVSIIEDFRES
ncbi:hypothetical protein ABEB36_010381 [Hypothenemus hampei]|uniref:RNase H type-1 domain-containing protein n=1 Tax=Hypothenemus hampei TaxID=57062 RepID=A0ABD1EJN7_HYPHA